MESQVNATSLYPTMQAAYLPAANNTIYNVPTAPSVPLKELGMPIAVQPQSQVQPQAQPVLVLSNNAIPPLGHTPQRLSCPHCNSKIVSRLDYRVTKRTHAFALCILFSGLVFCAPVPYCMKTCKSLDHYCPSCNQFIGKSVT